jgi:hypothetical protein
LQIFQSSDVENLIDDAVAENVKGYHVAWHLNFRWPLSVTMTAPGCAPLESNHGCMLAVCVTPGDELKVLEMN